MPFLRCTRLVVLILGRARSFMSFPVVFYVLVLAIALEMLASVLVVFSLYRRAKTPPGYLGFSFRFELWNRLICPGYRLPLSIAFANVHLIKDFKCIYVLRVYPIRVLEGSIESTTYENWHDSFALYR